MSDTPGLVDHLFRQRAGQMVAWLTRIFGPAHLDLAEEAVQEALLKALQQWPYTGVPSNPAGWLVRVARNAAIDRLRRDASLRDRAGAILDDLTRTAGSNPGPDAEIQDDELRMIFLCCHPELPKDGRVALSLKLASGFSAQEIARAFLTGEATIAQRIVRSKRRLRELDVRFELPSGVALTERLDSVLEVIYLLFNEGYAAAGGDDLVRVDLCTEALRLARLVAASPATNRPAAHALVALIAFQSARLPARIDDLGEVVLLEAQDRRLWDHRLIALGFAHLDESAQGSTMTPYHLQAAIAAVHAGAASGVDTPWEVILGFYDDLVALHRSPLVCLNRVVAVWKVRGLEPALLDLAALEQEPSLANYYLLPAVKGRLLAAAGDQAGACEAFSAAQKFACSEPERRLLQREVERLRT
jgi:RNA polymerase sigma-70 factor, ECF subfamily